MWGFGCNRREYGRMGVSKREGRKRVRHIAGVGEDTAKEMEIVEVVAERKLN